MISEFSKEKVFWTRKMNLKLVKFIESRPNIWNPKHPKYTSVEYRDQTYAEFATKYGNEFSGQAVKHRWTNIRSTFANYLRKLRASRSKIDGEEYKVNWHLWKPCQFLMKINKKIKEECNTSETYVAVAEEFENNEEFCPDKEQDWSSEDGFPDIQNSNNTSSRCSDIANSLVEVLGGIQNDAFGINNTKHGRVGNIVAKRLSRMNSYDAARVTEKIMQVLLLYDENNPNNPNNLKF